AVRIAEDGVRYDCITGVIETKGCWNPELFMAMEAQLYRAYLVPLAAPTGIYLVGWFDKPKWDEIDRRRGQTPDETLAEIRRRLDSQAASLSDGYLVRAVALDCHAMSPASDRGTHPARRFRDGGRGDRAVKKAARPTRTARVRRPPKAATAAVAAR